MQESRQQAIKQYVRMFNDLIEIVLIGAVCAQSSTIHVQITNMSDLVG